MKKSAYKSNSDLFNEVETVKKRIKKTIHEKSRNATASPSATANSKASRKIGKRC